MILNAVGDKIQNGYYRFHSGFKRVKNFIYNDNLVSVVKSTVGYGPNFLTSDYLFSKELKEFIIKRKTINFNNQFVDLNDYPIYNSNFDKNIIDKDFFSEIIKLPQKYKSFFIKDSLFFLLSDFYLPKTVFQKNLFKYIHYATSDMRLENLPFVVNKMRGLGTGLTPSGDDFNVGIMYALHLIAFYKKIDIDKILIQCYKNALGENKISNSFLYFAYKNSYFEDFKLLLENIKKPDCSLFLKKLLSHGHTSGSDMLAGFILTIKNNFY